MKSKEEEEVLESTDTSMGYTQYQTPKLSVDEEEERLKKLEGKDQIQKKQFFEMCQKALKLGYLKKQLGKIVSREKFICPKIERQKQEMGPDRKMEVVTETLCSIFEAYDDGDNILLQQQFKQLEDIFLKDYQQIHYKSNMALIFSEGKKLRKQSEFCVNKIKETKSLIYSEQFKRKMTRVRKNKSSSIGKILYRKQTSTQLQIISQKKAFNLLNNFYLLK